MRYSVASYESRASNAPLGPNGLPLFPDDSQRFERVLRTHRRRRDVYGGFDIAGKYTRGFRAPNTTDLGIIGFVGTGFEVDALRPRLAVVSSARQPAVTLFPPAFRSTRLDPEYSDSFDLSFRYTSRRFSAELTGFTTKLKDVYFDQALVLPPGATGTFLGSEQIIAQNAAGLVFVRPRRRPPCWCVSTFDDARFNGVEFNGRARFTDQWSGTANFTYIRAHSLLNGLPPNVEGGVPPATVL